MKRFIDAFFNTASDRLEGHFYGHFLFAWLSVNWKIWYVTFFVGEEFFQDKYNMLKFEYIVSLYPFSNSQEIFLTLSKLLLLPGIFVYVLIRWVSKLDCLVFRIVEENENKKKIIKQDLEKKELNAETKILEAVKKKGAVQKSLSNEDKWNIEYDELRNSSIFRTAVQSLHDCIYSRNGKMNTAYDSFDSRQLSFLHLNALIGDPVNNHIDVTEKGKFFLRQYLKGK